MAYYTSLSRVSDYKHHPTDVLAGAIIGAVVAALTTFVVADMFREPPAGADDGRREGTGERSQDGRAIKNSVEMGVQDRR
jgi:hypothetical protein